MKIIFLILALLFLTTFAFGKRKDRPLKALSKSEILKDLKSKPKTLKPLGKKPALANGVQTDFYVQRFSETLKPDSAWQLTFPPIEGGFLLFDINAQILGSKLHPEMELSGADSIFKITPALFKNKIDGGFWGSQSDFINILNLEEPPEKFSIKVSDQKFGEGGYFEFSFLTFEAQKIDSLDTEPNDEFSTSQTLQADFTEGNLFTLGSLKFTKVDSSDDLVESESDFFNFEAIAGVPYEITLNSNTIEGFNSAFDSFVRVYDPNRILITQNDDYFYFLDSRTVFKPTVSGQHFIEITSASNSFSDQNLSFDRLSLPYEILVRKIQELTFTENFVIDSTNLTTTQKLDFAQTKSIEFAFTTNNNGWIFEFETNSQGLGFSLDTKLKVYSLVSGTPQLIAENDDKNFPFAIDSRLTTILPDSGDYKLVVENHLPFGGEISDYLTEELQGILSYRYIGSDVNEENDFFWSATQIPLPESLEKPNYSYSYNLKGNLLGKDDLDYFVFNLRDSTDFKHYTVFQDTLKSRPIFFTFYNNKIAESENPMEILFKFYDKDFNLFGTNEVLVGNNFYPEILTFQNDGKFYLELSHNNGEFGDYDVSFKMDAGFEIELPEELKELATYDEIGIPLSSSWESKPITLDFKNKSDFYYLTFEVDSNLVYADTSFEDSTITIREVELMIENKISGGRGMKIFVEFLSDDGSLIRLANGDASDSLALGDSTITEFFFPFNVGFVPERDYVRISHFNGNFTNAQITLHLFAYEFEEPLFQIKLKDSTDSRILQPIPEKYDLSQNFPNPFNPNTQINYSLKQPETVNLKIFNVLGQEVISLVNSESQKEGTHSIHWNGTDRNRNQVGSGIYFYRIEAGEFVKTKKMLLLR